MKPSTPQSYIIKSFKHDGHLHRMWLDNWLVPSHLLDPRHAAESIIVLVNSQTKVMEADGREWRSRFPGVAFFIPNQWYNIVALIEGTGIRYYCNIASPRYISRNVITYIDYDLDVIFTPSRETHVVDQEEFELHRVHYRYSPFVEAKVKAGLEHLLIRIQQKSIPFEDDVVLAYYQLWKDNETEV
jgi:protein associated with RNAse G/E